MPPRRTLSLVGDDSVQTLTLAADNLLVESDDDEQSIFCPWRTRRKHPLVVPLRQVVGASVHGGQLRISYLVATERCLVLRETRGTVQDSDRSHEEEWVSQLLLSAYEGIKQQRRLKVILNPHGGRGKAKSIYTEKVEPILVAAGCHLDVTYTTHANHAFEIAQDLDLDYDVIVAVSGDGIVHELLNGFAKHKTPGKAFNIPIAPIPAGSGNALALNLLGLKDGWDPACTALNVLKGRPMKADLFALTQGNRKIISFMSQSIGLMAELDLGTEHLRWMGDIRFVYGYIKGVMACRPCPIELSMKLVADDKSNMAEVLTSTKERRGDNSPITPMSPISPISLFSSMDEDAPLLKKWLKKSVAKKDGWLTFDKPILFAYAGKGPYVSRDLMQFPVSMPDDGLIDISIQQITGRHKLLKALEGAERGETYWLSSNHYFKASAYRVRPLVKKGMFSVDGEHLPFEEYTVEVLQGMGTFLSPYGYYAPEFKSAVRD